MPPSQGYRYCLTCIDRYSRWPEVVPLADQEAETVATAFYAAWICRFGTPLRITTDQGRQFESNLFKLLNRLTGTTHLRTTAYHPAANGMVERLHRQLKAAIKCHENDTWVDTLPTVLLGIRSAWKEDLQATAAEMLYGESLRLPGEFLVPIPHDQGDVTAGAQFITNLRQHLQTLRPAEVNRHGNRKSFVFKDLATTSHVFVRRDGTKGLLQQPYEGPFPVVKRLDKMFVVNVRGMEKCISVDRLKPAYIVDDSSRNSDTRNDNANVTIDTDDDTPISSHRRDCDTQHPPPDPAGNFTTRTGRRIRFPERFQGGFS